MRGIDTHHQRSRVKCHHLAKSAREWGVRSRRDSDHLSMPLLVVLPIVPAIPAPTPSAVAATGCKCRCSYFFFFFRRFGLRVPKTNRDQCCTTSTSRPSTQPPRRRPVTPTPLLLPPRHHFSETPLHNCELAVMGWAHHLVDSLLHTPRASRSRRSAWTRRDSRRGHLQVIH